MADRDGNRDTHEYHTDIPMKSEPYALRGCNALEWGMKNRLSNIFDPVSGRTVMLAFDHGYFQGPTSDILGVFLKEPLDVVTINGRTAIKTEVSADRDDSTKTSKIDGHGRCR